jgi:hypothetical protein
VTPEGWAILGLFVVSLLATVLLPAGYRPPVLIGLGLLYLALSFWFSNR